MALLALCLGVMKLMPTLTFMDGTVGTVLLILGGCCLVGCGATLFMALRTRRMLTALSGEFGVSTHRELSEKLSVIAEIRGKRDSLLRATEDARTAEVEATRRYEKAKERLTELILRWSSEVPDTALDAFLDGLEQRVADFLAEKESKWEEKNLTELTVKEIRRTLSDKSEIDIRAGVSPLKRKALAEINHDQIINELAACKVTITEQDALAFRVESELDLLKNRAVDPTEVHSKMRRLTDRIDELNMRYKAYALAYGTIENASASLRESISPRLGSFVTELMGQMTDAKYTSVDVSEGLTVRFADASGELRSVDFLSDGTQDMVYVAVRMALIDMLYSEKPPVLLDETFAHQDNPRSRAMMQVMAALADEGYQSFIFTCRGREAMLVRELDERAGIFTLSVGGTD